MVSALGTLLGLMTVLLPLWCQPLNFFIFAAFRAAAFSAFSNYGARAFGPDATGSLLGLIFFQFHQIFVGVYFFHFPGRIRLYALACTAVV